MNKRIKDCAKLLRARNYNSILVSNPANISYLTGFKEGGGYLLVTANEELIYFTNFLYMEAAKKIKVWKLIINDSGKDVFGLIVKEVKKLRHKKLAFEAKYLSMREYKPLKRFFLKEAIELLPTQDLIEEIRMVKDKSEISLIKKSIQITKQAIDFADEIFAPQMSETTLSIEIERFLRLKGDNQVAFPSIVASGKNTAFPHHSPTDETIGKRIFLIDLGSKYYGYCADLTRVFFNGKISTLFKKIYDTVRIAQAESIKKIKDGAKAGNIDKAARGVIEEKGWGKYFGHGVGHGIGLCVHELPVLKPGSQTILKEGMVVTIEPAVYFKDKFGIRIEDMVLVKRKRGEVLSGDINR